MMTTNLQHVFTRPGPFVTVHAEVGRPAEDARQQIDARWTAIRHELERQEVDAALLEEIGRRLHEVPDVAGEARRTIVAAAGEVVLDQVHSGRTTAAETVDVGPLPDLASYLTLADRQLPFALVVTDREGAEIGFHPGLAAADPHEVSVSGEELHLQKVKVGGWRHDHMQQNSENTWARNAAEVADEVRSGLRSHAAEVVMLAGDERARHLVAEALGDVQVPVVHVEAGGRAAGASETALWEEVRRVVAQVEASADADVVERLAAAEGQSGAAATGVDDVLDALVRGQVERLVIDPAAAAGETVDPADHPGLPLPEGAAGPLPADRVLLAGAAATAAEVSVLPREQTGGTGVAALLRWDDAADRRTEV